MSIQNDDEMF